ncbi:BatD family protein [Dokdonia sp.]|uniref:BatD family protein n=1 Tax=Dokdonia sp. TaxID=2024995 RepID=UPI0032647CD1
MKLKLYILFILLPSMGTIFTQNGPFNTKAEYAEVSMNASIDKSKHIDIASEKIHVIAEISKSNPYLNQGFVLEHKMYVSPDISINNWKEIGSLKFTNFWSQDIAEKPFKIHEGKYKGKPYRYVILKRTVLYPQKTGELTIEPLTLNISTTVPTKERDAFGRFVTEKIDITVASENKIVDVKPLPLEGKPNNFTGAVGTFDFTVKTDKNPLHTSEIFQISVTVKGNGNLPLFNLPNPNVSNKLKVSQLESADEIRSDLTGVNGLKKNVYILKVITHNEKYTIAPITFNYFNPKTERYESKTSDEYVIEVTSNGKQEIRGKINKKNKNH